MKQPRVVLATLCALAIGVLASASAARAATQAGAPTVPVPAFALANLPGDLSALSKGALAAPPVANGNAVPVGYEVSAQIPPISYAGTAGPGTYAFVWLSCPARGVPDTSCATRSAEPTQKGDPSRGNSTITASADDAMRYLRFQLTVTPSGTWDSSTKVTTDPGKDILVIPKGAQGTPPEVTKYQVPGTTGSAKLAAWTIPADSVLRERKVTAWACISGTAGQVRDAAFDTAAAGCSTVPVPTKVSDTIDAKDVQLQIPSDARGKYLVVEDALTMATGSNSTLSTWVVRSNPAQLEGTQATPTPQPTSQAITMMVIAKANATRGKPFTVAVSMSPTTTSGTGTARLLSVNRPKTKPIALGRITVADGTGILERAISATATKGAYRLVVTVTPEGGSAVTGERRVTIR